MDTLKRREEIIRDSAFDEKKKKHRVKFNPGLALNWAQGYKTDNQIRAIKLWCFVIAMEMVS